MSLSTAREATSSSGSVRMFPEVYASMARRASAPAETPSRRLISRSFFTLLRGTRYCWRMRSSAFADIPESSDLSSMNFKAIIANHTHTQPHTQHSISHARFHEHVPRDVPLLVLLGSWHGWQQVLAVGLKPYVL